MIDLNNWAGNYAYSAARLHCPATIAELQEVVKGCEKLRALGSRHSFNGIADTRWDLVSTSALNSQIQIDVQQNTVAVDAGMTYGELARRLHAQGYALHNLASLPHISIAGACATATHGSGENHGNLAAAVAGIEFVSADGTVQSLSREQDDERFQGAVVGLGALGVVTKLTLDLVPTFDMRQDVYVDLPMTQLEDRFDAIQSSAYSVSFFTDWQRERFNQVWLKRRITSDATFAAEPALFEAPLATVRLHPLPEASAESCTEQMGVSGPWHERLPHFLADYTPSKGEELQSEYFVPRRHALAALQAISGLREQIAPSLLISEVRTIAADALWMSPCYQQDSVAIHFTWKKDWPAVEKLLPMIESQLASFAPRPHWGKLFTLRPEVLQSRYPRLKDFQNLLRAYDPQGKFRNDFIDRYIF